MEINTFQLFGNQVPLFLLASKGLAEWALLALFATCVVGGETEVPIFVDVTHQAGLDDMHPYHVAWGDFDNDGAVDLHEYKHVWRNVGGKFKCVAVLGGVGVWGDYNNDGYLDIFCARDQKLYQNIAGSSFKDESSQLPACPIGRPWSAAWADFDGDGFLDLYVTGFEAPNISAYHRDMRLRNRRDGSFEVVWTGGTQPGRGVTAADFDEDGDIDIYVSNYRLEPNILWRNDGSGSFKNVATPYQALGGHGHTIGSAWGDLDDDGHLDLFVGNFAHPGQPEPKFLRNLGPAGDWHFEDRSADAGLAFVESFASPALGDFDNDGDLDLFLTAVYSPDACVLYRNDGSWKFTNVTQQAGLAGLVTSEQGNWADYDNDGDLDLLADGRLFENRSNSGAWIKLRLVGRKSNRAAIGAQARVTIGDRTLTRQVAGGTGETHQNELSLHFGLGQEPGPVSVNILWPGGSTQKALVPANATTTIIQGDW
ncbi:MAG: CRTAC1 family protein [Pirellulales bacterium]|nr:CRTAC1 family protein [Pirellulales bacterium]